MKIVSSSQLVPGDVVIVPNDCLMPCDFVLLNGQCIVNESMLTGESVPVIKSALLPDSQTTYDPNEPDLSTKYTIFSGTQVIQSRSFS